MAVLASEQIMPNLEGLLSFHDKENPVTHLFIYRTNDVERSAQPAIRIRRMAESFFPHLKVTLHSPKKDEDGKNPNQVSKAIRQWFDDIPPEKIIVNATGGLKTMFAGALRLSHLRDHEIIYRDLDGTWLKLITTGGVLISKTIEIDRARLNNRLKKLGIIDLVRIQSGFDDIHSTPPRELDCVESLTTVIEKQWDWRSISPIQERSGFLFEHWFASLIATFDVDDIVVGLEPHDRIRAQMETDIWVLKDARLFMFDLKLISKKQQKSSMAEQITNASAQADKFAGITVKTILVRPGYSYSGSENDAKSIKKLAGKFSCDVWFQDDIPQIMSHLADLFGQKSTQHEIIYDMFQMAKQRDGFLIADPDYTIHAQEYPVCPSMI